MKIFIQKSFLHLLLAATVFAGLGFVYAALPEVNPADNLTDTAWNDVVGAINNFSFDNGNIGIGVETPGSNLTILADQNTSSINLVRADGTSVMTSGSFLGGANGFLRLHNTDGSIGTQLSTHPYSIPTYFNSTSVGIGTTTPDSGLKLDVEGKIGATEYCDENGANCTLAADLSSDGPSFGPIISVSLGQQVRTNTCTGPTANFTVTDAGMYKLRMSASAYRYTGNYDNLRLYVKNSSGGIITSRTDTMMRGTTGGGYMLIEGSELVVMSAGVYEISLYGSDSYSCTGSSIDKIFGATVTAQKLNW